MVIFRLLKIIETFIRTKEEGMSCHISASGGVENYVKRIKKVI